MTAPDDKHRTPDQSRGEADDGPDSAPLQRLLREALKAPPEQPRSLLPKIQERIRRRTRGRFFRDRYSRSLDPVPLLLTIALLLLLLAAAFLLVLQPLTDDPRAIELDAAPPDLLAPSSRELAPQTAPPQD